VQYIRKKYKEKEKTRVRETEERRGEGRCKGGSLVKFNG
jgi:hypothetical protein